MAAGGRRSILNAVASGFVLAGAALLLPSLAEAQSHGTLQVSATVVDSKASLRSLDAARLAISQWAAPKAMSHDDVTTLAQVSTALQATTRRAGDEPAGHPAPATTSTLVVQIDYVKN